MKLRNLNAFPTSETATDGMSLRDWFAGQALIGLASTASSGKANDHQPTPDEVALQCYVMADAMLQASGHKVFE